MSPQSPRDQAVERWREEVREAEARRTEGVEMGRTWAYARAWTTVCDVKDLDEEATMDDLRRALSRTLGEMPGNMDIDALFQIKSMTGAMVGGFVQGVREVYDDVRDEVDPPGRTCA